ncbi:MAG: hypothetical protein II830_03055, partial [Alphaproteobacteria bacterium]|nr:hypothetical protein [Alphaproteobacteria bacterium]
LAIVGVLTVGGFSLVSKVNNGNQVNTTIDEVSSLASKVRIVARDYTAGDGTFMKYVCKAKAYPDTLDCDLAEGSAADDTCNCSAFTGNADVTYTVATDSYPVLFSLTASNLTEEMCMALLTTNWGSATTTGFIEINGSGTSTSTDSIARAAASCSGDSNSLTLKFR